MSRTRACRGPVGVRPSSQTRLVARLANAWALATLLATPAREAFAAEEPPQQLELAADGEAHDDYRNDLWVQLTTEDWQPGKVGEFNTTVPMKDMACEGPPARLVSNPELGWEGIKVLLRQHLGQPLRDAFLFQSIVRIQQDEPDECVLGISTTAAFILPVTMIRVRNVARMLSTDQDLLKLDVSFFDILRSGFPVFGVLDGLATPELRAFYPETGDTCCRSPQALALQRAIAAYRAAGGHVARPPPLLAAVALLETGAGVAEEVAGASGGTSCPIPAAAAFVVTAVHRAEARTASQGEGWRRAALRDVLELVSRAEQLVKDHSKATEYPFGQLVGSHFELFWLLDELQLLLPRLVDSHRGAGNAGDARVGREEL